MISTVTRFFQPPMPPNKEVVEMPGVWKTLRVSHTPLETVPSGRFPHSHNLTCSLQRGHCYLMKKGTFLINVDRNPNLYNCERPTVFS
jgi:hypothetical protein